MGTLIDGREPGSNWDACFYTTKHSWKGKYKRIFCIGKDCIATINPSNFEETNRPIFPAFKQHWSESRKDVLLSVQPKGIAQVNSGGEVLAMYEYKDIEAFLYVSTVSDYPGGFIIMDRAFRRLHMFAMEKRDDFLQLATKAAGTYVGVTLKKKKQDVTLEDFRRNRLGALSKSESAITSLAEFIVTKSSPRHMEPVQRIFCLTESCLVERDPASYAIVTLRPLELIFSIVRDPRDPQLFRIEYTTGAVRSYYSTDRDPLLASLLDSVRATGNKCVCVQMAPTDRAERFQPLTTPPEEEVESSLLKFIASPNTGWFKENKEKLILAALSSLLKQGDQSDSPEHIAGEFLAIRRLVASKAGFQAFTHLPSFKEEIGQKVIRALQINNDGVTYAALDMLSTLMITNADAQTSALVVSMLLDFFTFAIGSQYSETTSGKDFDEILRMVSDLGRSLYQLFEHPSMAIVKAAGLLMKSIVEEGEEDMCEQMQSLALAEGALLRHLYTALYTKSTDNRMLTHRQLSRHLVALWVEKNKLAEAMLRRMFPAGLLDALHSEEKVPERDIDRVNVRDNLNVAKQQTKTPTTRKLEQLLLHWRSRSGHSSGKGIVPTLRRRRQHVKIENNWDFFYFQFAKDHARADLIWNFKTREELKECIDGELRAFHADKDLRGKYIVAWNHTEFEVRYESLADEVKIGDHFLRLLLENDPNSTRIHNAPQFFNDLYHRFLLTSKSSEEIGVFNDTEFVVHMLNQCSNKLERDRLLQFLYALLLNEKNVKLFVDAGGIRCLVDLVTLAHLHTNRAITPMQTLMIEASQSQLDTDEPEWFYTKTDVQSKIGPIGFSDLKSLFSAGEIGHDTKIWAQGLEGWKPLKSIPQLKWTLVADGTPALDYSQLCTLCLDMLIKICQYYPSRNEDGAVIRPLPRCKRMLSDTLCLPHIVQLLLTFEPNIVERTSKLLGIIMQDNTSVSRLFLTGVFFFLMMYTGSNLLPIARFLRDTHNYQSYKTDQDTGRSILGAMLPKAMVCFLDNHGPEKFASTFLGEFDTPEAIWGANMRRLLIEKIAVHLSDFTPRLKSNSRAIYQYCPLPKVSYPELENELFCNIYYLRHLCDEQRFGDWPIKNHIELLRDILDAWKQENEKKPQTMSVEEAYATLGLESSMKYDQRKVRKAYFKMSMQYHPDKNPEGREMFEKVNKAYEFVSSMENRCMEGANPENIVLILRAQSILYKRYPEVLHPYKYAGYPMLTVTIERETIDENLFSSSISLLNAACELSYETVKCSPLNATEMMRQGGFEKLAAAFVRCISVVGGHTNDSEPPVKVCTNIAKCYAAAAQFEECRDRIAEIDSIIPNLCRCLWIQGAPALTSAAIDCVCNFSASAALQEAMIRNGALWHIIQLLFGYDYTLDDSEIEKNEETHQQEYVNKNAKVGVRALAMLVGLQTNLTLHKTGYDGLNALFTPFILEQLSNEDPKPFLKLFNGNTETPYLIWDNSTRAELTEYLEMQQEAIIKKGEQDDSLGAEMRYSAHANETMVDNIYLRIYNEQPTFPLREPQRFTKALLDFIGTKAQYVWSATMKREEECHVDEERISQTLKEVTGALESLRNVVTANAGVEQACIGHFKLLFSLLKQTGNSEMQLMTLQVIGKVTANRGCVKDIASANVLVFLLFTLETLPSGRSTALEALHALVSNNKCIEQILTHGGTIYLLNLFCSSGSPVVRQMTASLFGKMLADKLHGPRVRITLSKFLPPIFMEAVRDNAEASVSMFESNHENPELIWGDEAREQVRSTVRKLLDELFTKQQQSPDMKWGLPLDFEVVYESLHGEVVVGGVFLRLLIAQPSWTFRKPKEFVVALMDKYMSMLNKATFDTEELERLKIITDASAALFHAQPDLANSVPAMGHLHKMMGLIERNGQAVQHSTLVFFNELAGNLTCVRALGSIVCIPAFKTALSNATSEYLPAGCEMLMKIFEKNVSPLVQQALEANLILFLLELLKSGLDLCEHSSSCKAHVVKALKAMERDLLHGEEVHNILEKCPWWAAFKDQRHDLFITSTATAGYLTGPTASVAGYLTAGPQTTAAMDTAPPEMIVEEDRSVRAAPGNPDA
eukprot:gene8081-757_t